jgi:hypothetical protein
MHLFHADDLSAHQQFTATTLLILEFGGYLAHLLLGTYFVWRMKNITLIHANLRLILVCFWRFYRFCFVLENLGKRRNFYLKIGE